ncbi:MAG: TRAP transporter permease [Candidatus Tectomicrobia bacterium]|uniref:TRAP transporter permease n=1 Tax=Tectimicrobiota bacterium TaxID=2528274 RepID=A0A932I224_UNCTE|nr:TRAP transporter permease [Candidatus Tectomicrobia bacterium]
MNTSFHPASGPPAPPDPGPGAESRAQRRLPPFFDGQVRLLAAAMGAFYIYSAVFGVAAPQWHRGLYLGLTFGMAFLLFPLRGASPAGRPSAFDMAFAALSLGAVGYWIWQYEGLAYRAGDYTGLDYYVSIAGVLLSLEACRRVTGMAMSVVAVGALLFAYFGPYFPEMLAHRGVPVRRLAEYLFLTDDGVFGVMTNVMATYVLIFMYLGSFMARSGAGKFFIDFPLALMGRAVGGPAKVAVFSSAIFGSISGASVANIVATGTFTIPLMKRTGFKPHVAAAIENTASTGGQLLPPVMGVGAFIMAELTGISYGHIALVAAIPALLYYLSIGIMVHCEAKRLGLRGLPEGEVRPAGAVLREGWFHAIPLSLLMLFLYAGYSPPYCAGVAVGATVLVSWLNRDPGLRMGPRGVWDALIDGSASSLIVGATAGAIGIIVGVVSLTGLGLKLSNIIVSLAGSSLLAAVFLVALASLVLGMGLPITASYLVLAVLAVPALAEFGVPVLAAHMIVFWLSQDSNFTPPVCLGAYVAASIAGADPWKTGWASLKFGKMLYVMALLFAYTSILFTGTLEQSLWAVFSALVGTVAFSFWTMRFCYGPTSHPEWLALGASTVLCFIPGVFTDMAGIALFALVYYAQYRRYKRPLPAPAPAGGA